MDEVNQHDAAPAYDANRLLDALIEKLSLKTDPALSRLPDVYPPVLSKIRHGELPVGASPIIRIQDVSNFSLKKMRALMGDRSTKFRAFGRSASWRRLTDQKDS